MVLTIGWCLLENLLTGEMHFSTRKVRILNLACHKPFHVASGGIGLQHVALKTHVMRCNGLMMTYLKFAFSIFPIFTWSQFRFYPYLGSLLSALPIVSTGAYYRQETVTRSKRWGLLTGGAYYRVVLTNGSLRCRSWYSRNCTK